MSLQQVGDKDVMIVIDDVKKYLWWRAVVWNKIFLLQRLYIGTIFLKSILPFPSPLFVRRLWVHLKVRQTLLQFLEKTAVGSVMVRKATRLTGIFETGFPFAFSLSVKKKIVTPDAAAERREIVVGVITVVTVVIGRYPIHTSCCTGSSSGQCWYQLQYHRRDRRYAIFDGKDGAVPCNTTTGRDRDVVATVVQVIQEHFRYFQESKFPLLHEVTFAPANDCRSIQIEVVGIK